MNNEDRIRELTIELKGMMEQNRQLWRWIDSLRVDKGIREFEIDRLNKRINEMELHAQGWI